jgi:alkanesulfonate monooxygenase SsuD/methylene tetrahydromethanopterin reductase-like flavin-dependent oxidoreductase (luciferase family)
VGSRQRTRRGLLLREDAGMVTLGAIARPQLPPEALLPFALAADEAGLAELWLWEDCFAEGGLSTAAALLASTQHLRVGVGILPTPLRNVALTAMEVATIDRLFPGRLRVGVGHGVQEWMAQVGARAASPLGLLREYATALRALLAGDEVTSSGRYVSLDRVRLEWPPAVAVPVLSGATGPRTLLLTGEVADGTILTAGTTPDGLRAARAVLDGARASAGRAGRHEVVVYALTAYGEGGRERAEAEARDWGLSPGADVIIGGGAHEVAAGVRRLEQAGAGTVVLQPPGDEPDPEGFVRWAGEQVQPLLVRGE